MTHQVEAFFDPVTSTVSYVVYEAAGSACAVIDPVLDFDARSGRTSTHCADRIAAFVRQQRLQVQWLLETHAHADHLSAAPYLRGQLGGKIAVGARIRDVQSKFRDIYNLGPVPGQHVGGLNDFDHLFGPDERFAIGNLQACAWQVPGHTPADTAYLIDGAGVFVGDTLFMPDVGTARCDFPGGDAGVLYESIRRLLELPPETRLFICHDYPPPGRGPAWSCTVAEQRAANVHMRSGVERDKFIEMRTTRDAQLALPALMLAAVQVNIRAGELPRPEGNGVRYLKIPLNLL
jgi:glyoxylase-like metal-dependent hydrolase (beta-lactamase superfamily II)